LGELADGLELSVAEEDEDGDSVAAGDEAVAGVWSCGIEPDCAITSPAGAIEIKAANIKVLRVVMDLSDLIKWRGHILKRWPVQRYRP